ncbi:threonylcarbamoyl-AMP synthase [Aquibacillus halophilus]|uniref:Threonylcarbamoyl-AMP synthase n=1 Tax=Aquibacillus halophilus TaxID=930132 RepID=A0A6A8DHK0_9BACI|nr:L-threonylcarbamoyladenylate synthase [Aquibacillus halophilus]MRH43976.1 threonylcarbamoyl-AMP synthase [Aquibacillus halophilus]
MNYETKLWKIEDITKNSTQIEAAANLLKKQEVIAFPTETVYGLGADATNEQAIAKIFEAKGRPSDNPLIVHVANKRQIDQYVSNIPDIAEKLIDAFMPGPLTIILSSNGVIAKNVTAGLSTIAIRIPDHPVARHLLEACQLPLAAPSANKSGKPSPTSATHVYQDLNGKIAGILDGGNTGVGLESTVLDCTSELPIILRPGGVTKDQIEQVIGTVMIDPALAKTDDQPKSPGMKYTHYQPEAPLWLVDGDADFFQAQIELNTDKGYKVGVMASKELAALLHTDNIKTCGTRANLNEVAAQLYETLRAFKKSDVDLILCESFEQAGVGDAIMNRLHKAASKKIKQSLSPDETSL